MTGLFAKAKTIAKAPTAKAKQDKQEINLAKLQQLCEIKALMQTLEGTYKSLETEVKAAGFEEFLKMETQGRPESFRGIDGMASASVEMRKRGTNSALNEDECKLLREHGIEPFKQEVTKQLFAINPIYAEDENLLAKVEKAIAKIVPEDFIVQQEGTHKFVVTDEMLDLAFKKRDKAVLEVTTCMALKPKLSDEYPMAKLFDNVKEIVQPTTKAKSVALPGTKSAKKAA